jgi:hypothetical protein
MNQFEFDSKTGANSNRQNGSTRRGVIELYPGIIAYKPELLSLDIRGPAGAFRGSAVIDKATAKKVGAALLQWSGFNVDVDLLVNQINWLAGLGLGLCDEQEGLLNLLGELRDLMEEKGV